MNTERIKNFFKRNSFFIAASACVLCFATGVSVGGKIGRSTRNGEVAMLTAQLETERASLADANIQQAQAQADSALNEIRKLYQGVTCIASWYGYESGKITASGMPYNPLDRTMAHRTLPFGTIVFLERGPKYTVAKITDRGPYIMGRHIDLSLQLARDLGMEEAGVATVRMRVLHLPTMEMAEPRWAGRTEMIE